MKTINLLAVLIAATFTSFSQQHKDSGELEFRAFKIGEKVDTTQFKKYANLYFPNYLDGWTMQNVRELPTKYKAYPVAIWQLKRDSSIALTLVGNIVLNITVSYMPGAEKNTLERALNETLGEGKTKTYQQTHPLQSWITYWKLITWQKDGIIVQIGNSEMRMPDTPAKKELFWNLVYSDLGREEKIISEYKSK